MTVYWVTVPKMIHQTLMVEANSAKEAKQIADGANGDDPRIDYIGFEVVKTMKATDAKPA